MLKLMIQPSSFAGFAAIGSLIATLFAEGVPHGVTGWASVAVPVLAGLAAILRNDGSNIPLPPFTGVTTDGK